MSASQDKGRARQATPSGRAASTHAATRTAFAAAPGSTDMFTSLPKVRPRMTTRIEDDFMCAEHDGRVIAAARYSESAY